MTAQQQTKKLVKCLVWDLDDTLWEGTLLESGGLILKDGVLDIIKAVSARGILQSVASKNDHDDASRRLQQFGLNEYFLYPQINWNPKSESIRNIANKINIGLDTIAFIDDQPFEREEVAFSLPEILCIDAKDLGSLLSLPEMNPSFVTEDAAQRTRMYLDEIERNRAEEQFNGPQEEFLATLGMEFTISAAGEGDLQRAEELTVRTNQLNTTGYTFSYEELDHLRKSDSHKVLIASLKDKFGTYGKIGLAVIECQRGVWILKLLLMSCRVVSRGVGSIMLNHIMRAAKAANVSLQAEFIANGRNRLMYATYKFANFREVARDGEKIILQNDLSNLRNDPAYVKLSYGDRNHH